MTDTHREKRYDTLVVGGGVIGLACAWRASRRGLRVCVLERAEIGAGASGVAAGMLAPVGESSWGEEELLGLNAASHAIWPSFASELADDSGLDPGFIAVGALHVALDRDEAEELRRRHRLHQELGLETRWLLPAECRRLEPGLAPGLAGGLLAPGEASVDPRALCAALAAAVQAAGGRIETEAEVIDADLGAQRSSVRTADGRSFEAADVVLASGSWSGVAGWIELSHRPRVRPVKGEILTLRGSAQAPVCERIVVTERVYAVPRADGTLIVGATAEERGFETTVSAGGVLELLREAYRALPEVAELELVEARAGLRPATPDNRPLIGRGQPEGLILATGHFRNGILQAPVTGEAIAALLAGEDPRVNLDPFSPMRFVGEREAALQ